MRKRWNYLGWLAAASLIFSGCGAPAPPPASERAPIPALRQSENRVEPEVTSAETLSTAQAEKQGSENTVEPEVTAQDTLTAAQMELLAALNGHGVAPELQNETWFNSEPLTLADLRGQVVIVEFWTYG